MQLSDRFLLSSHGVLDPGSSAAKKEEGEGLKQLTESGLKLVYQAIYENLFN